MGSAKRSQRHGKHQVQMRQRTTRSSKGRLLSDPAQNTQLLTEQLRSLGLYAAPTLGDGNCLFRALSDQLFGTPSHHAQLRKDICDWIQAHKPRYEPFVEDERGLDVHLRCMRENATYGGHLELSAFAHMTRRNVKVIQPGLVYVIEWAGGADPAATNRTSAPTMPEDNLDDDDSNLNDRDRRRLRREKKKVAKGKTPAVPPATAAADNDDSEETPSSTIYVAYHDWEHFSSIRNLNGPHTGLPSVQEVSSDAPTPPSPRKKSAPPSSTSDKRIPKVKLKLSAPSSNSPSTPAIPLLPIKDPPTPADIPLPPSRQSSPTPSLTPSLSPPPPSRSLRVPPLTRASASAPAKSHSLRVHRSPKRSFDESSAGSGSGSESIGRRTRSRLGSAAVSAPPRVGRDDMDVDGEQDIDADADTPELSAPGSSSSSLPNSAASSPPPPEPEVEVEVETDGLPNTKSTPAMAVDRPLTRRQRKALGLPKPRPAASAGVGKIVIPGGRYHARRGVGVWNQDQGEDDEEEAEWTRNGTGRVDVRGFRELKI